MPLIKKAYHLYSGFKLGDQDKKWVLHIVCQLCAMCLGGCTLGLNWVTKTRTGRCTLCANRVQYVFWRLDKS